MSTRTIQNNRSAGNTLPQQTKRSVNCNLIIFPLLTLIPLHLNGSRARKEKFQEKRRGKPEAKIRRRAGWQGRQKKGLYCVRFGHDGMLSAVTCYQGAPNGEGGHEKT